MLKSHHAPHAMLVAPQHVRAEAERRALVARAERAPVKDGLADDGGVQAFTPIAQDDRVQFQSGDT
jgi:hypothetical protein